VSKRFIDTGIWDQKWFRSLDLKHKLLWLYATTRCDSVGLFEFDDVIVSAYLKDNIVREDLDRLGGRVCHIGGDKFLIPQFIIFQYGNLNPINKAHLGIMKKLTSLVEGIDLSSLSDESRVLINTWGTLCRGSSEGQQTPQVKEEVQVEVKEKVQEKEEEKKKSSKPRPINCTEKEFELAWAAYPRHRKRTYSLECFKAKIKPNQLQNFIEACKSYESEVNIKSMKPAHTWHMSTFINQSHWKDYIQGVEPEMSTKLKKTQDPFHLIPEDKKCP